MKHYRSVRPLVAAIAVIAALSSMSGIGLFTVADYEDEIAVLEKRQAELAEERKQVEGLLAEYSEKVEKEEKYLQLYDDKMALQEEEMQNLEKQISILDEDIARLDDEIEKKSQELDEGIEEFRQRLRAMYVSGNDSVAQVLAGSTDFYDILARMEIIQRVSEHDNAMLTDLVDKVHTLNSDKESLETERAAAEEKRAEQSAVLAELQNTYAGHAETKAWFEAEAEAQLSRTEEIEAEEQQTEEDLQDYIRKQQDEIAARMAEKTEKQKKAREAKERKEEKKKRTETTTEAPKETEVTTEATTAPNNILLVDEADFIEVTGIYEDIETTAAVTEETTVYTTEPVVETEPEVTTASFEETESYYEDEEDQLSEEEMAYYDGDKGYGTYVDTGFIWPCPNVKNITDDYGDRYIEEEGSSSFHKGIDINKPGCAGEDIVASAGGVVIQAGDKGNGYGICVIIDHGDGISTLYAHMSSCSVSVGDEIQQGDLIGHIGQTGYAYGNHCHFEVRINGQHTDPFNYVSY